MFEAHFFILVENQASLPPPILFFKPSLNLRPVCKFEVVRCGPVEEYFVCPGLDVASCQSLKTPFS